MISYLRARRTLAGVACALTLGLGVPAVASTQANAATSSTVAAGSTAAPLQNAITATAQRPGAPNAEEDSWNGCNAGYFCATPELEPVCAGETCNWPGGPGSGNGDSETLENYILAGGVWWDPWGAAGFPGYDIGIHGWANNTGYRVWLEQYQDSGNELCISNHTIAPGNYEGVDEDDYWIYISNNPNAC